ncbi:hypothetical protein BK654_29835 [Pseudomonas brassicacearum]|uniref:MFS transporter n=1 Tax=Pseudomonas brassicacearum TaxID=930166 RepID=UPI000F46B8BC|nr:MFS transporter [Pseudomonas brassicacearum]ROM69903.1 hypothetical protein BK654_29835 [Pseudomonas brassicacearum]
MSTLMTIMAIAPLAGPTVGGQILRFGSWQAIFWSLVFIAVVTLISLYKLPETLPHQRRSPASLKQIIKRYGSFFRDSRFLGYTAAGAFFYAGTFAYIAASPFAYITYYHVSRVTAILRPAICGRDYRHDGHRTNKREVPEALRHRNDDADRGITVSLRRLDAGG